MSNLIDKVIKPLTIHVKSYIKDSIHFFNKCTRNVTNETVLVTFDVCSLYTSIPHELGIEAVKFYIEKHPETIQKRFELNFILESIDFILKNNTFMFNGENYLQLCGTAMGTIFSPTYATLIVGYLENKMYIIIEINYGIDVRKYIEENWDRFLDDCFTLLDENKISAIDLLNILNSLNPNIKFTMEVSKTNIPFLDILVNKNEKTLWMDIYSKPTDAKRYVPFSSCHPKHCLTNIPFCLARRICMIVENNEQKTLKLNELKSLLTKQNYPKKLIESGIQRAENIPQNSLRKPKEKNNSKIIPFITTNNPNNPNIFPIIKTTVEQLEASKTLKVELKNSNLINCKRQPPNLERFLCKTKYIRPEKVKVSKLKGRAAS